MELEIKRYCIDINTGVLEENDCGKLTDYSTVKSLQQELEATKAERDELKSLLKIEREHRITGAGGIGF